MKRRSTNLRIWSEFLYKISYDTSEHTLSALKLHISNTQLPHTTAVPLQHLPAMASKQLQRQINSVIIGITKAQEARPGQVQAVQRLVEEEGDTARIALVAATGYGNSAVLFAFSALKKRITIQIVPLTKLGESQLQDIASGVPGSNPTLVG